MKNKRRYQSKHDKRYNLDKHMIKPGEVVDEIEFYNECRDEELYYNKLDSYDSIGATYSEWEPHIIIYRKRYEKK